MTAKRTRRTQFPAQLNTAGDSGSIASEVPLTSPQMRIFAPLQQGLAKLASTWKWLQDRSKAQRKTRKLRVCEVSQLGEKRFVALVQADGQRFLIGGTSTSVTLLATLPSKKNFRSMLPKDVSLEAPEK